MRLIVYEGDTFSENAA